jgi:type IV pilus assembly protein PilP
MMMKRVFLSVSMAAVLTVAVAAVRAQTPAPATPSSPSSSSTSSTAAATSGTQESEVQKSLEEILEEPATADTYRYDPQGRRDPFRSLIGPTPRLDRGSRPEGVPGFLIDELKLQGVFKTRQGLTAMVNAPDNKGYLVRIGDKVLDGEIIRITATSIVFRQEVNDPTRIERYREVVKDLTPSAPVKP